MLVAVLRSESPRTRATPAAVVPLQPAQAPEAPTLAAATASGLHWCLLPADWLMLPPFAVVAAAEKAAAAENASAAATEGGHAARGTLPVDRLLVPRSAAETTAVEGAAAVSGIAVLVSFATVVAVTVEAAAPVVVSVGKQPLLLLIASAKASEASAGATTPSGIESAAPIPTAEGCLLQPGGARGPPPLLLKLPPEF
jgi:hypothetical protein